MDYSTEEGRQKHKEAKARYKQKHAERVKESAKKSSDKYRESNKEKVSESRRKSARKFYKKNKHLYLLNTAYRRAKKKSSCGEINKNIRDILLCRQRHMCAVCRTDLRTTKSHLDHINPLSKGGEHSNHNLQMLCALCNLKKNAKDPIEFMQENGYLI